MSRDKDINRLGDAMKKMFSEYSIDNKFDQTELIASWRQIVGDMIANRTQNLYIRNEILFVEISSASLKQELNMSKSRILELIESELGHLAVKNIQFL